MEVPLLPPRVSSVWQSGRILCAQNPQRQLPVFIVRELHPPSRGPGSIGPILHRPLRCYRQALDPQLQLLVNEAECQLGGSQRHVTDLRGVTTCWPGSSHASSIVNRLTTTTVAWQALDPQLPSTRQQSWVPVRRLPAPRHRFEGGSMMCWPESFHASSIVNRITTTSLASSWSPTSNYPSTKLSAN